MILISMTLEIESTFSLYVLNNTYVNLTSDVRTFTQEYNISRFDYSDSENLTISDRYFIDSGYFDRNKLDEKLKNITKCTSKINEYFKYIKAHLEAKQKIDPYFNYYK